ncbi:hypothetical protein CCR94_15505 [Rhodoblastus sphagnicola]|uniref:Uncharacterized protein n=1 Tax=Rhodoblastus sphagnicola TaxID=333368 RepID=A0A2S6N430_9HYPH|nr:hypothetical protein [Rhodoblastus sphagnicola]MBB4199843.1 hypothetical protein [Rhodoblastus sphagnicola]PPQ29362.1 hypothetical protein CCR94_15505 [Rhodoblastus sphagnicola]
MLNHKTRLAVALCSALLALPAAAAEPLGSSWADVTKMPDFFTGNWQSVTSFLDNPTNTPLTPQAQAYISGFKPVVDIPFAGANCKTPGMPIVQRLGSPLKFFYEPGMIAIYIENSSMTRFIKLNAKHPEQPNPTFLGDSIGRFEGDTLVVESISFDDILFQYGDLPGQGRGPFVLPPEAIYGPHGPNLRMVERIRLLDKDTLEDQLTIFDDTVWKEPYVSKPVQIFKRNRGAAGIPAEWVCNTGNILAFDPAQNKTISEDPAEVLKRLKASEKH